MLDRTFLQSRPEVTLVPEWPPWILACAGEGNPGPWEAELSQSLGELCPWPRLDTYPNPKPPRAECDSAACPQETSWAPHATAGRPACQGHGAGGHLHPPAVLCCLRICACLLGIHSSQGQLHWLHISFAGFSMFWSLWLRYPSQDQPTLSNCKGLGGGDALSYANQTTQSPQIPWKKYSLLGNDSAGPYPSAKMCIYIYI